MPMIVDMRLLWRGLGLESIAIETAKLLNMSLCHEQQITSTIHTFVVYNAGTET